MLTELELLSNTIRISEDQAENLLTKTDNLNQLRIRLSTRFEGIEEQTIGLNKKFVFFAL